VIRRGQLREISTVLECCCGKEGQSDKSRRLQQNQQAVQKGLQQGRSERRGESYFVPYVEPLSEARTTLADFFNSLLVGLPLPPEDPQ
jgi:hypothetical protein